eukprot:5620657-Pyramimonas_sp.AAC.2
MEGFKHYQWSLLNISNLLVFLDLLRIVSCRPRNDGAPLDLAAPLIPPPGRRPLKNYSSPYQADNG